MFIDARAIPQGTVIEADLCIVGAGAAGITLARELAGPFTVCLLESGGLGFDDETNELSRAVNVGEWPVNLDVARLRYFGGSTNHWGGQCGPFDELDFEPRPWIPHSGWPIARDALEPYYPRAQALCELGPLDYSVTFWTEFVKEFGAARVPVDGNLVTEKLFQHSPPTRFGDVYRADIERSDKIKSLLYANASELEIDSDARSVTSASVGCLDGRRFKVAARLFILAGGIENARLLLLSRSTAPRGLGNEHDLVGRYFMDNLTMVSGKLHLERPDDFVKYYDIFGWEDRIEPTGLYFTDSFQPTRATQERERIGNYVAFLHNGYVGEWSRGYRALRQLYGQIRQGYLPTQLGRQVAAVFTQPTKVTAGVYSWFLGKERFREFVIYHHWEQSPNPDSRITLHETECDALGLPKLKMDWRFTPLERRTAARGQQLVAEAIERAGVGRVELEFSESDPWPENFTSSAHFMGSTRMHADPRQGVVDADCRVHGISNLYVAGGSVFPTNGATMPTYNIVALALRLAEHIRHSAANDDVAVAGRAAGSVSGLATQSQRRVSPSSELENMSEEGAGA